MRQRRTAPLTGSQRLLTRPAGAVASQNHTTLNRVPVDGGIGRAVLTCWEPLDWDDERLPERLRRVDLGAGLTAAGFGDAEVCDRPALDPGDDPAPYRQSRHVRRFDVPGSWRLCTRHVVCFLNSLRTVQPKLEAATFRFPGAAAGE